MSQAKREGLLSIRADGYEDLRQAIVNGELLPGERLLEEELSARLGSGACPRTRRWRSSRPDAAEARAAQD
jgi:DNA-binding GntR family transcriptional regulator